MAEEFDGSLSANGAQKAADFVRFCDAFNIPVLTLTNVSGFKASDYDEKHLAAAAARLAGAFAEATVPKVNVDVYKRQILAMENAGQLIEDEELRAQIKGSGIGTSATRGEILKKLFNNKYLALNKKKMCIRDSRRSGLGPPGALSR